jgi:putative lipoic acid-binding regulatory protein
MYAWDRDSGTVVGATPGGRGTDFIVFIVCITEGLDIKDLHQRPSSRGNFITEGISIKSTAAAAARAVL